MRALALIIIVAGLFLAGGAVWYFYGQVKMAEARLRNQGPQVIRVPTVSIAVANGPLRYGQTLDDKVVRLVDWPEDALPENSFQALDDLFNENGPARVVLRRMEKGEPILKSKVSGFGERATVAALLDPGMRGHTLTVNAKSSVGGFLLPGTHIDIILTVDDRYEGLKTYFLLQNIEVIAVDQDTDTDRIAARLARTITVQVTPDEVKALTLAERLGRVDITLRGFDNDEELSSESLNRQQLLGETAPEAPVAPTPDVTVRVRKGSDSLETMKVE
jgi:pilus assembly protein CpaB